MRGKLSSTRSQSRNGAGELPPNPSAPPRGLIASAPFETLVVHWQNELAVLSRRAPQSDGAATLKLVIAELTRALDEARSSNVYLRVDDVSRITGRSPQTITRICRQFGQLAGATKVQGQWSIHWPTFEDFIKSGKDIHPMEAA